MSNLKWRNENIKFQLILKDLKDGKIRIPLFQRNYVWSHKEIIDLLNSIKDGNPIGNFIFWEASTRERINDHNQIIKSISTNENYGGDICYVIDGQQRLTTITTLFCLSALKKEKIKDLNKFEQIFFNIETSLFEKVSKNKINPKIHFSIADIFWDNNIEENIDEVFIEKGLSLNDNRNRKIKYSIKDMVETFWSLDISVLKLTNTYELEEVIVLFERINTKGKKLSVFEIVSAKWYKFGIDLKDEFQSLSNNYEFDFDIILDSMFFIINDEKPILKSIDKINFEISDECEIIKQKLVKFKKSIEMTHRYLDNLNMSQKRITPSKNIIKWLSYLYFKNDNNDLIGNQDAELKKYICLLCLNNSYGSSTNNQLSEDVKFCNALVDNDLKKINEIFNKFKKKVFDIDCFLSISSESDMLAKLVISCLIDNEDFITNQKIDINNYDLHHIYPKNGYKEARYEDIKWAIHSYANITPINSKSNKSILNKKFSNYIDEIEESNRRLSNNLVKHCIDIDQFKKDFEPADIENALKERSKKLVEIINEKFQLN